MSEQTMMNDDEIAAFKTQVKQQIIEEMKDERTAALEEAAQRREQEAVDRKKYFDKMKDSPDPWVEIISWIETDQGVKVELEWNDAFIDHLKVEGVTGADEDQIVQKWVAVLLHNIADDMGAKTVPDGESEFQG